MKKGREVGHCIQKYFQIVKEKFMRIQNKFQIYSELFYTKLIGTFFKINLEIIFKELIKKLLGINC